MKESDRLILLKRPVVLTIVEEPFVPDAAPLDEIDRRWAERCDRNPAYFDGPLLHILGVHRNGAGGAIMHAARSSYRFFAVQDARFDLGIRPLGVKAFSEQDGSMLLGRRSDSVAWYPGHWEFAPSGAVEPDQTPEQAIVTELTEETGLTTSAPVHAVAIMFDHITRSWEIVHRMTPTGTLAPGDGEYTEMTWRRPGDWPRALTPIARRMTQLLDRT